MYVIVKKKIYHKYVGASVTNIKLCGHHKALCNYFVDLL